MAKQTINNLESAATVRSKINSNFTELYDQKADKNHAFSDTSYGAATDALFGHVKVTPGNGLGISNGTLTMGLASPTVAGAVLLASSVDSTGENTVPTIAQLKSINEDLKNLKDNTPPKNHAVSNNTYGLATNTLYGHIRVTASNGLNLSDGTLSINQASTSARGTVQLADSLTSQANNMALTAKQGYTLDQKKPEVFYGSNTPSNSTGRNGDIYFLI